MYPALLLFPFIVLTSGTILIWLIKNLRWTRYIALITTCLTLILTLITTICFDPHYIGFQFISEFDWIPNLGIHFLIGVDGISIFFLPATTLLFTGVILTDWNQIGIDSDLSIKKDQHGPKLYYSLLFILEGSILGVFCALDLILFFLFWELTLIPIFFLIHFWGTGENRQQAAIQYTLLMLAGGAPLLFCFILLAFQSGWIFDLPRLLEIPRPTSFEVLIFFLFLFGFGVKIPYIPFHTWLPLVATEGPIATIAIITGLKLGAYGLIRLALPLAPHAAHEFHWLLAGLGVAGMLFGALVALAQTDQRRMLAYLSLSHVSWVILGLASFNFQGLQGAILHLINFTLASGGAFLLIAFLQTRTGTTDIRNLGGVSQTMPLLAGLFLVVGLTNLGMPGTSGFPGEWLILIGVFKTHVGAGVTALFVIVLGAASFLGLYRHIFLGVIKNSRVSELIDLRPRELGIGLVLILIIGLIGFFPNLLLDSMQTTDWLILPKAKVGGH